MLSSDPKTHAADTPDTARKLRVTVLAGGPSVEREVSLDSGRAVADALRRRGHNVHLADIGPDDLSALAAPADVVFPALHGTFGEDGQVQLVMEQHGIRFVGSGSAASALAMDKVATKRIAAELGILTPDFEAVSAGQEPKLTPPVVVKPVDQGSSVSTWIVRDGAALAPAMIDVCAKFGRALVERFIPGDELTVGILGDHALSPICIRPKQGFYDYHAKYHDDRTEYLFDTHPSGLLERLQSDSLRLFRRLGCRHLGRVDWIVDAGSRGWLLEVNTIPGFTSHSLTPMAALHEGVPFDVLVERLTFMALEEGS